ncbi:MAG: hypothetical protein P1V20_27930 [Verrucomicrobiales bacterium]|nr:hypothetical protein [Verrucomicrobiales bacterium]
MASAQQQGADDVQLHRCNPGPWGNLEYFYTFLEAPDHIMELINTPSEQTIWGFPGKTPDEILRFLEEAGMEKSAIEDAFQRSNAFQLGTYYKLYPSAKSVIELKPESRLAIYRELRRSTSNRLHRNPVVIESGDVQKWFRHSNLSAETISLIEKLCYRVGNTLMFSDTPVLLNGVEDDKQDRALLKSLTRTRSLIVRLRVTPNTDFNALGKYWNSGLEQKDLLPILKSYAMSPAINAIDLAHLLPPTPRKYIYTFPSPELGIDGIYPDSFWTALNFFNYLPTEEFDHQETITAYFRNTFVEVPSPTQFGDVILINDAETRATRHACIYIADDIVYTKNSRSIMAPFMLMKLSDLLARFGAAGRQNISTWRRISPQ